MTGVIKGVEKYLKDKKKALAPEKKARLISLLYGHFAKTGEDVDQKCDIRFERSSFCFTGPAETGPRRKLHEITRKLDGRPVDRVIESLDYLVIGAQSSPCWAYSTYGRKIEKVIENRKKGVTTNILHENDFVSQAKKEKPAICNDFKM